MYQNKQFELEKKLAEAHREQIEESIKARMQPLKDISAFYQEAREKEKEIQKERMEAMSAGMTERPLTEYEQLIKAITTLTESLNK